MTRHRRVRIGLALLAGGLICLSLPPWGWWPLAWVGIALWGWLSDGPWRSRAAIGALVTAAWYLPSTLWMVKFSPAGWPFGVALWFPALGALTGVLCPRDWRRFCVLPAGLILSEWVRWHAPFGGVPLSMLAMTQARGPLLPIARVGGSMLVGAAVALVGSGVGLLAIRRRRAGAVMLGSVLAVTVLGVFAPNGHNGRSIRVAIVQGGGPQETRASSSDASLVFQRHLRASQQIRQPVDLVVWPENVVNVARFDGSAEQAELIALARRLHATIEAGIVESDTPTTFRNASIVIGPDGETVGRYDKVRRVPFGEYVPLRSFFDQFAHDLLPPRDQVPGRDQNVIRTRVGRLGVVISWEVFFGRRARAAMHRDADLLLNPTNGSSYWLTEVQTQQVASSQLRAVESGRWLLQAAPTGFSAIVSPDGEVVQRSAVSEARVLQGRVWLRHGSTLAVVTGDLFALCVAVLMLCVGWVGLLPPRRHSGRYSVWRSSHRRPTI